MPRLIAIARVWKLDHLVVQIVVALFVWRVLPDPVSIPGRGGGIEWVLHPILPLLYTVSVTNAAGFTNLDVEQTSSGGVVKRRMLFLSVTSLMAVGAASIAGVNETVAVRNTILLFGLALLITPISGPVRWALLPVLASASWLVGVPRPGQTPPGWAVLLHHSSSKLALVVAITLYVSGVVFYSATGGNIRSGHG